MEMEPVSSKGFVYYDFGEKFLDETMVSIQTLYEHNPHAKICLLTNPEGKQYVEKKFSHIPLDHLIAIERKPKAQPKAQKDEPLVFFKLSVKEFSPYEKTIYLDGDTYITDYIEDLFDLMDTFDFVIVPDESHPSRGGIIGLKGGYRALGYYNCGFFMFRKSKAVDELFDHWKEEYLAVGDLDVDQGALVRALIKTHLRFITLPKEYNLRIINKCASFQNRVKIVHGRIQNPQKLIRKINNIQFVASGSRVWIPHLQLLLKASSFQWIYRFRKLFSLRRVKEDVGIKEHTDVSYIKKLIRRVYANRFPVDQNTDGSDKALFDDFIQTHSIQSVLEYTVGRLKNGHSERVSARNLKFRLLRSLGLRHEWLRPRDDIFNSPTMKKTYFLEYVKDKNILYQVQDLRIKEKMSMRTWDLVAIFEIPTASRFSDSKKLLECFVSQSSKFIFISLKPNQPDFEWVQLLSDRGFYFDPYLTAHLRSLSQSTHLKKNLLVFERSTYISNHLDGR